MLIAGGSISGLTLALIFEGYGIDYLLLEKHAEIAPFLGTTVGINPNGARILDQLGVYSELDRIGAKHDTNNYYDWQGKLLATQKPLDPLMTWLLVNRKATPSLKDEVYTNRKFLILVLDITFAFSTDRILFACYMERSKTSLNYGQQSKL